MKKLLFITCLILAGIFVKAQNETTRKEQVYTLAEQMPEFPGGETAMMKFIKKNVVYPAFEKQHHIGGTVYVTFVVDTVGNVTQVKLFRGVPKGPYLEREAIRVVRAMPAWIPGKINGKAVNVQFNFPIKFTIPHPNPKLAEKVTEESASKIRTIYTYYDLGVEKFNSGIYEGAILDFSDAIVVSNNTNKDALYKRAQTYLKLNKKELACSDFQSLKDLNDPIGKKMLKKYCK